MAVVLQHSLVPGLDMADMGDVVAHTSLFLQIIVAVAINKERPPLPHDTPPRMAALIVRCWSENPALRPRVDELLAELEDMMKVCGAVLHTVLAAAALRLTPCGQGSWYARRICWL